MDEIEALRAEVAALRAEVASLRAHAGGGLAASEPATSLDRRRLFLLAAGSAAAAATAGLASASPAAAAQGAMQFGTTNDAGIDATSLASSSPVNTLRLTNTAANSGSNSTLVVGTAHAGAITALSTGTREAVYAAATSGPALLTRSTTGPSLRMVGDQIGVPTVGSWQAGDLVTDQSGAFWACVADGTPGTWRRLAGPTTAGAFVAVAPYRAYDSRRPQPDPGSLASGSARVIDVSIARAPDGIPIAINQIPLGASAVAMNLTITGTEGSGGWLAVMPGMQLQVATSAINWTAPGVTTSNAIIVGLSATRTIRVVCGPAGGGRATEFVVDVSGYWR